MSAYELYRCIEILRKKPKWFFQTENTAEKLHSLDMIKKIGTPSTIQVLIPFLKNDHFQIRNKAAEAIIHLFGKLQSQNDYDTALKHLPIERSDLDVYRVEFNENTYVQLLCISSSNRSGYVREKAVRELGCMKDPAGLKFVLLRLADWVGAVREAATAATSAFLTKDYVEHLLKQSTILKWLLTVERVDLTEIHERIVLFIFNQNRSEAFLEQLKRLEDSCRYWFYNTLLNRIQPNKQEIQIIRSDRNHLVRSALLRKSSAFDTETRNEVILTFLRDPLATLRRDALEAGTKLGLVPEEKLISYLSDEGSAVRELSRFLLKGKGLDFAALYRQRVAKSQLLPGSLFGLSETGSKEDLSVFEHYLQSGNNKVMLACLTAIGKIDEGRAVGHALDLLTHPSGKLRDKAVDILAKSRNPKALQKVRQVYATTDYAAKKTILKLWHKIGGWIILGDLLLALSDENVYIRNLGWQQLESWKQKAYRLFTTPSTMDLERAQRIYNSIESDKLTLTPARDKLLSELAFFLR